MTLLYKHYISKQIIKNNFNNILNIKDIINKNLLELKLKGLNLYNKNLNLFILNSNNKNLILNINKNSLSKIEYNIKDITNKNNIKINNIKKNKIQINSYIDFIKLNKLIIKNTNKLVNYNQEISYHYNFNNKIIKNIYKFLSYSFLSMNSLISKPIFEITNEKIIIHLFFYLFKNNSNLTFIKLNNIKLNIICKILNQFFNKPIELDLVRLYYPYFDSNIFVNLLQKLINKIQIRIIMKKFFKKAMIKNPNKINQKINFIPSFLSGICVQIKGRLMTQRIVPKQTNKIIRKGTLARGKINYLDEVRFTNKNKRGAFTITIKIGHYLT